MKVGKTINGRVQGTGMSIWNGEGKESKDYEGGRSTK